MGAMMRAYDWSTTSLGAPSKWPSALKTSLRLLLTSRHPMFIWWGPDLLQFYNDAYLETLGSERHPSALGQEGKACWEEIWHIIGPDIEFVMSGQGATWHEDTLVPVTRHGKREDVWWTYGYTPIEDDIGIRGVLVICIDVTEKHTQNERLKTSYYSLVQALDQGFCVIEPMFDVSGRAVDYRFLETNHSFVEQTGLQDAAGKTAKELVPGLEGHWVETYGQVALTGDAIRFEEESPSMDRWFDVYATRVGGSESRHVALLFTDITERKRNAQIAKQNAEQQAFSLELTDLLRNFTEPEGIIAAACEMLGRKLDVARVLYGEVAEDGESVFVRCDWTAEGVQSVAGLSRQLSQFGPRMAAALRTGEVVVNNDVSQDLRSAEYSDAYSAIGVRSALLVPLIKGGRLALALAFHRTAPYRWSKEDVKLAQDMAERTWSAVEVARAQAELRHERNQSQYIFDSMVEGFTLLSRDWIILRMNAAGLKITQRDAQEVVGRNHWDIWPELKGTRLEQIYHEVKQTNIAEIFEFPFTFRDGRDGWIEGRAQSTFDGGLAVFFRDITERKNGEEKLRDADRRKDEFLAMLAHELRNPLAPIGAAAQLLQIAKLDETRVRHTSQIIGRQVAHMTHLINDLLDVSRVTRGLVELDNAPLDIRHIVTDAVEQVTPLMQSRRHRLALHLPPETTMVLGDKKRLVQVLTNILNNAAKYTNEGGNIVLKTDVREAHILISIVDNGIGMTPELTAHAFDLFAQAERTSDRSAGGLGLGLSLVKSLVELHNGHVTCESEGIGKGSTFTVCLPRVVAPVRHDDHPEDNGFQTSTRRLRVLVVDDNVDAASVLAMLLEAAGHYVLVEHGARAALERATAERPDVCLLDIGLPGMDGNQLAQHLRGQPETANSMLIAVTGYGQENDRKRTVAAGFDHHLVKPIDTNQLNSILTEYKKPQMPAK